ncbi:hypothetical protein JMUB6875_64310 [Nocardia sp. JMUB6875]
MLVCTAISGALILRAWLTRSVVRRARVRHGRHRRLPPALVFGHVTLALLTAATWTTFVIVGNHDLAAYAVALLAATATLGATMFVRWIPTYRSGLTAVDGPGAAHRAGPDTNLPLRVVLAHGGFAVVTTTLATFVLLTHR